MKYILIKKKECTCEKLLGKIKQTLSDDVSGVKYRNFKISAKVGQDNVNIVDLTIFRLANTSLLQVY